MASYIQLELVGDPQSRGSAYGHHAREHIVENIATYKQRLSHGGLTWGDAQTRARGFLPAVKSFAPDLLIELEAMARTAEVDLDDLLVLNTRTSLIYNLDDCTSVALVSPDNNRCEVLGQNWDNMARLKPVLLRVAEPGEPTILTLTEAGTLAKIGFNTAGIGVCVNGLGRPGNPEEMSVPIFVFLRRLLRMRSLEAAQELVLGCNRDAPHNFVIASREDGAACIETLYSQAEVLSAQCDAVFHTNHLIGKLLPKSDVSAASTNSVRRLRRAAELVGEGRAEPRTPERLLKLLSDHAGEPDSICRHRSMSNGGLQTITKHAVVMDLVAGEMQISDGPPCSSAIDVYPIAESATVE